MYVTIYIEKYLGIHTQIYGKLYLRVDKITGDFYL